METDLPIDLVPTVLRPSLEISWSHLVARGEDRTEWSPAFRAELAKVWAASDFVSQSTLREPALFTDLATDERRDQPRAEGSAAAELQALLAPVGDEASLAKALRQFRRAEMVRIAWRDITNRATLDETLSDLSNLAELCLHHALTSLETWQRELWGVPSNAAGMPQHMVVLAMGKLGGRELNFSSDIDLIFAYGEDGDVVNGSRSRSNAEFFTRLGQSLIRVLDQVTADGFVFRVDMRLRPNGDSGPLVLPFDAFENYYSASGRDWERYAMIKARPVAGDLNLGQRLLDMLRPFVYRRYLDFNAVESLRDMKRMIASQTERRGAEDNLKLGPGGIRDVEFIVQSLQLLWGGRDPRLRTWSLREALAQLAESGLLSRTHSEQLAHGYAFLRQLENRLQAIDDRQTQTLPRDEVTQARLAHAMGFASYPALVSALDASRAPLIKLFDELVGADIESSARDMPRPEEQLWNGELGEEESLRALIDAGMKDAASAHHRLVHFRSCPAVRALSESARKRLDVLMPLLIAEVAGTPNPDNTLARAVALLESIVRRTTYIALLVESPAARAELVRLIGASPWIAERLGRHPILLDELLNPEALHAPHSREAMSDDLARRMQSARSGDLEHEMEILREFKGAQVLHVAAAEVSGRKHLMKVSDALSDIAEVTLEGTLQLAWRDTVEKFGEPQATNAGAVRVPAFGIIGYGKLGGLELGYGSDLDLVFLHDSVGDKQVTNGDRAVDNAVFFARLGQRIMHYLSTRTPAGVAYEVDMRLRPSGNSGLLVGSIDAFDRYQQVDAWTWEHQALVRARFIAGATSLLERFAAIRRQVLTTQRDVDALRHEVRSMREKMRVALDKQEGFDLKQSVGGMVDIEFIAQYCVLAWSHQYPELSEWSDNVRIFESAAASGLMQSEDARALTDGYLALRAEHHRLSLLEEPGVVHDGAFDAIRNEVERCWKAYLSES